ncbi:tetratricopeptide repeat protein [Nocardioides guangzhouensis]|nr:tetratricopeptide repeat protein [Nocardioides guangzhouensis]
MFNPMLPSLDAYDAYRWAQDRFDHRDYYAAAKVLRRLVDEHPHEHELGDARELLARAYYHSAQLEPAVTTARELLAARPDHAYAALLLARSLERLSRHEEAASARRLADALGAVA